MGELIFCGLLAVFCTIMLICGWFTTNVFLNDELVRIYPCAILALTVVCLIIHCIGLYRKLSPEEKKKSLIDIFQLREKRTWLFLATIGLTVLYFSMLDRIGYLPITPIIVTWYIMTLGEKKWWKALLVALGLTIVVYCIFVYGLQIRLPRGKGVFRDFSLVVEYLLS